MVSEASPKKLGDWRGRVGIGVDEKEDQQVGMGTYNQVEVHTGQTLWRVRGVG